MPIKYNKDIISQKGKSTKGRCRNCKKEFFRTKTEQKFCTNKCAKEYQAVKRPDETQLAILLEKYSMNQIAKMYDVSETAIRKWVKEAGLISKPRGFWARIFGKKG